MPKVAFADLFTNKPGAMVARVPSFTGSLGSPYDHRGLVYVHLDELQEMFGVCLIKSLNFIMLAYLETAAGFILPVSRARMLI